MYDHILQLLNDKNRSKVSTRLKTEQDPLGFKKYIDSIAKELTKKSSQDNINKLESKYGSKTMMIKGGVPTIHPLQYGTENYTIAPQNEVDMAINFNTLTARPAMMGGCVATPLFNEIQKYLRTILKGKGVKTSAITSVAGMVTHRIMDNIEKMNKSNRLRRLTT